MTVTVTTSTTTAGSALRPAKSCFNLPDDNNPLINATRLGNSDHKSTLLIGRDESQRVQLIRFHGPRRLDDIITLDDGTIKPHLFSVGFISHIICSNGQNLINLKSFCSRTPFITGYNEIDWMYRIGLDGGTRNSYRPSPSAKSAPQESALPSSPTGRINTNEIRVDGLQFLIHSNRNAVTAGLF